jgi:hypothetical protein
MLAWSDLNTVTKNSTRDIQPNNRSKKKRCTTNTRSGNVIKRKENYWRSLQNKIWCWSYKAKRCRPFLTSEHTWMTRSCVHYKQRNTFKLFLFFLQPDSSFDLLCCRGFIKGKWTQRMENHFVHVSTVTGKHIQLTLNGIRNGILYNIYIIYIIYLTANGF